MHGITLPITTLQQFIMHGITLPITTLQQFIMHGITLSNYYPITVYNAWYHTFELLPYNSL